MTTEITRPCGKRILYVCPATMRGNVVAEFRRWSPQRSVVDLGQKTKKDRRVILDLMTTFPEYVCVINYEAWRKDMALIDDLANINFDTLVIDEAHMIKDLESIAYKGLKRLVDSADIPFVFPMTGSPILNKPEEIFALLSLVDPNSFYSLKYFRQDYLVQDTYTGKWEFQHGGMDRLARRISPQFLRRTKEQAGIKLPPKTITIHEILIDEELYPKQADARNQMRKWGSIVLDAEEGKAISAAAMIAVYTRLRQIETWPDGIKLTDPKTHEVLLQLDTKESQKIDYVIKNNGDTNGLLPEIIFDERCVVFSQFKEPLREINRRCEAAGIRSVVLDGDTPTSLREEIRKDFDIRETPDRKDSKWDVVLCNYKVGGIGLNFTSATQMIILDEEWNPGKRDQAYDRIHRIGQDKPVTIHVLRAKNPATDFGIDVWLAAIIDDKENLVEGFNMTMDAEAGRNALRDGLI